MVESTEVEVEDEVEAASRQEESGTEPPKLWRELEDPRTVENHMLEAEESAMDQSRLQEHGRHQDSREELAKSANLHLLQSYLVTGGALRNIWTKSWAILKRRGRRREMK